MQKAMAEDSFGQKLSGASQVWWLVVELVDDFLRHLLQASPMRPVCRQSRVLPLVLGLYSVNSVKPGASKILD